MSAITDKQREHAQTVLAKMNVQTQDDVRYLINAFHEQGREFCGAQFNALCTKRNWKLFEAAIIKDTVLTLI